MHVVLTSEEQGRQDGLVGELAGAVEVFGVRAGSGFGGGETAGELCGEEGGQLCRGEEKVREDGLTSQGGSAEIWAREVAVRALRAVAIRNFILIDVVECCGWMNWF